MFIYGQLGNLIKTNASISITQTVPTLRHGLGHLKLALHPRYTLGTLFKPSLVLFNPAYYLGTF